MTTQDDSKNYRKNVRRTLTYTPLVTIPLLLDLFLFWRTGKTVLSPILDVFLLVSMALLFLLASAATRTSSYRG